MHRITELEDLLYADSNGSYRKQLISMLDAEKKRLQADIQLGCAPVQYGEYTRQLAAIEHTYTVVNTIWSIYHELLRSTALPPTLNK